MKRRVAAMVVVTLLVGVSLSSGQLRMRVHEGQRVREFTLSKVDSVNFYYDAGPEMVLVPSGSFVMGDGVAYCGVDQHEVALTRGFLIGSHEVTNQDYLEALQWAYDQGLATATASTVRDNLDGSTSQLLELGSSACEIQFDADPGVFYLRESPTSSAQNAYPGGYDPADHPVKAVTWFGAARYCDWLSLQADLPRAYEHSGGWSCNDGDPYGAAGYRLPTDAEWEFAAQYDDERVYPWGDLSPTCELANYSGCVGWTWPVGSCPEGNSSLGCSDLAGNIHEWCNDWWVCSLGTGAVTDPIGGSTGTDRVCRGGNWTLIVSRLRLASRQGVSPGDSNSGYGFRVARTASR